MTRAWLTIGMAGLLATGLLAQDQERDNRQPRERRPPERRDDNRGMPGRGMMPGGGGAMAWGGGGVGVVRDMVMGRVLERLERGDLPPELALSAQELKFIRLRLASIEERLRQADRALMDAPEMAAFLATYREALAAHHAAMQANARIRAARERLAAIERGRADGGPRDADAWRRLREEMNEQRQLAEDIAAESRQDKAVQEAAAARQEAAAAALRLHAELAGKDAASQALKGEQDSLREAENDLLASLVAAASELGILPQPQQGRGRDRREPPAANPNPGNDLLPLEPQPGLDAF